MNRRKIAGINVLEVLPDGDKQAKAAIILLHGYATNAHDLYPLHESFNFPEPCAWYFPNGPLKIPLGPRMYSQAWFYIDIPKLQQAMSTGDYNLSELNGTTAPPGLHEAALQVYEMIHKISEELALPLDRIILGGFSQGTMISTEIILKLLPLEENFANLIILSGSVLCYERWMQAAIAKRKVQNLEKERGRLRGGTGLRFFQSHGYQDPVLSNVLVEKLYKVLTTAQVDSQRPLYWFTGGHEIPSNVIQALDKEFKDTLFAAPDKAIEQRLE